MPLALWGCQSTAPKPPQVETKETGKSPFAIPVDSGPVTITSKSEGKIGWVARAQASHTTFTDDGKPLETLDAVEGELYLAGQPASTFKSDRAHANQSTGELQLEGHVSLHNIEQKITLLADKVRWMEDRKLAAAEGNVTYASDDWTFGPTRVQWSKPDLSVIGTPDQFE